MRDTQAEMRAMRGIVELGPKRIFGPVRLYSGNATTIDYPLEPAPGGGAIKNVVYFVRVWEASDIAVQVSLNLSHSPDGQGPCPPAAHSPVITSAGLPGTPPVMDAGSTDVDHASQCQLGEWLHPTLRIGSDEGVKWAVVEVFEHRKRS